MADIREVTTSHLRQNIGGVITAVTAGETVRLVRGGHTVGYLVSPRDWNVLNGRTITETAAQAHTAITSVSQLVSTLVADPQWGMARVVVQAEGLPAAEVVITPDAHAEILRRVQAAKTAAQQPPTEGAA